MQSPLQKQEPRWERRKDARPKELIQAALDVFVEKGYAATRLDEVAKRAGVSKGTVYLYFANKEELFKAVVREGIVAPIVQAEDVVEHYEGSIAELLREMIKGWWRTVGSTKATGIPKLIIAEAGNFPELAQFYLEEVVLRAMKVQRRALQKGIDSGEFRHFDVDAMVHVICAPMLYLNIWKHSFGHHRPDSLEIDRYLDTYIDMTVRGLVKNPPVDNSKSGD